MPVSRMLGASIVAAADRRASRTARWVHASPTAPNVSPNGCATKIARDDASVTRRVAQNHRESGRVYDALKKVRAIETYPSVTNFILFRMKEQTPAAVHARFLEKGVLIRDISMWPGCAGCLRVSIGTPEENGRFIAALDHVFAAAPA